LNQPDDYDKSLCGQANLNCQGWTNSTGGKSYFKDPKDSVCEYRQKNGTTQIAWLKQHMKYCGANVATQLCTQDSDCASQAAAANKKCLEETVDVDCPNDSGSAKTFGAGGLPETIQPSTDGNTYWAGVCAAEDDTCTEYIEPLGKQSPNYLKNGNFDELDDQSATIDQWSGAVGNLTQLIKFDAKSMYYLGGSGAAGILSIDAACGDIHELRTDNTLNPVADAQVGLNAASYTGKTFYVNFAAGNSVSCDVSWSGPSAGAKLILRKVTVDYKLASSLNKKDCEGQVNFGTGCVLFNERAVADSGATAGNLVYNPSIFDANLFSDYTIPGVPATGPSNNSNVILKVESDRKCNKWLTCNGTVAYTDSNGVAKSYCSGLAMCDSLKADGGCAHIAKKDTSRQAFLGAGGLAQYSNYTGYAKAGLDFASTTQMTGFYAIDNMKQDGSFLEIPNGDFEFFSEQDECKAGANGSMGNIKV